MLPAIKPGDRLAVYPYKYDQLKPGVVVHRRAGAMSITHRTVWHSPGKGWVTRGDNAKHDDWGYMQRHDFLGIVYKIGPDGALTRP